MTSYVSIVECLQSVLSTQTLEFVAMLDQRVQDQMTHFNKQYEWLTKDWGRNKGTILRPTLILSQICWWRQDHLVDSIKIRCMDSPIPRLRTCGWPIVSQLLGARNQYGAPSLRSLWPCKNIRPISLKNINSLWIRKNSAKWFWIWDHKWVIHGAFFFWQYGPGNDQPPPPPPTPPLC